MNVRRREFLRFAAAGLVEVGASADWVCRADSRAPFNVRAFGAVADGKALDTSAVNRTIAAAAAAGGGTVHFPAGAYACHSIRLKSFVTLHLEAGATILAAPAGGYDAAEPNEPFERYQDFGHNHWHNSLIWGEDLRDVAIVGPGLICGRGLSRGEAAEPGLPPADTPGAADKAIALKRCPHALVAGDVEKYAKVKAEPALVLSIPDKPSEDDNGLLTASEIAMLKLNADFVVLSACNTAAGDTAEGSGWGLIGIRERVMALGGTLDVIDLGDKGFKLHAIIPFEAPAEPPP